MKQSQVLFALFATPLASAHYVFSRFILNGAESSDWEYIREVQQPSTGGPYMPTKFINSPMGHTPLDNDFRCNRNSFQSASKTKVASVKAGDSIGMKLAFGATMQHPGPLSVFISKAPSGDVTSYEGDGDWIKIHQKLVCGDMTSGYKDTDWCTWDQNTATFAIPNEIEDGEYLVRVEHIALHGAHVGEAELYYSCAQVSVTGGGSGISSPSVKIPGVYKASDGAVNYSIWSNPKSYPFVPGVAVASGGTTEGSADGKGTQAKAQAVSGSQATISSGGSATSATVAIPTTLQTSVRSTPASKPTVACGAGAFGRQ